MKVNVQTPDQTCYDGNATMVRIATEDGMLEVYPGHADLAGTIKFSHLWIVNGEQEERFLVRHGTLVVSQEHDHVSIMAFACDRRESLNYQSLQEYLEFLKKMAEQGESLDSFRVRYVQGELASVEKMIEVIRDNPEQR